MDITKIIRNLLNVAIVAYLLAFAYFAIFGGFDIDLRGFGIPFRIHMADMYKPSKIFFILVLARLTLGCFDSKSIDYIKKPFVRLYNSRLTNPCCILLGLIFLFALFLRVWGLGQGTEQYIYHPDAPKQIRAIFNFLEWKYSFDLRFLGNSHFAGYPYFAMHFPEFILRFINLFDSVTSFKVFNENYNTAVMVARLVNIVYSIFILFLVYRIGMKISGRFVAYLSLFLCSVSIIQIHMVKYVGNDLPMSFFSLIAVYFALKNLQGERLRWYILAGLFIGLSMASKYNGALTFVIIGLIYLSLRESFVDTLKSSGLIIKSVVTALLLFFFVNANFWVDPENAFRAIRESSNLVAHYGLYNHGHLEFLWSHLAYNYYVLNGVLSPVPVWIAAALLFVLVARRGSDHFYLWAGPAIIFIVGKITMPVSAANHYLNIAPIFLIAISMGVNEIMKMIRYRGVGAAIVALTCIYPAYYAIGDTSFWSLRPLKHEGQKWMSENADYEAHGAYALFYFSDCYTDSVAGRDPETNRFVINKFYYDLPKAPSLHRTRTNCLALLEPDPLFFPNTHWVDDENRATIYPANYNLVTTTKKFVTTKQAPVERLVKASELKGGITVLTDNCSQMKNNRVKVNIGGKKFEYNMAPGNKVVSEVTAPNRTWLYFGEYVSVIAESKESACWSVGTNPQDTGDIKLALGAREKAAESYLESGSPYSLIKAYLEGSETQKEKAHKEITRLYPKLLTGEYLKKATHSWNDAANYTSNLFDIKMVKEIKNTDTTNVSDPENIESVGPGETLYGPYIPLLQGDYTLYIKWSGSELLRSFDIDIVSLRSKNVITKKKITNNMAKNYATINFTIENFMEPDIEFRFYNVKGARLLIGQLLVKPQYHKPLKRLLQKFQRAVHQPQPEVSQN